MFGLKEASREVVVVADNREVIAGLEREWRDALCTKDMQKLAGLMHPISC